MSKTSRITYVDASWGPWRGCTKVSAGCENCYAERDMHRYGKDHSQVVRASDTTFYSPLKWPTGLRVFVCPWSDFFHEAADAWREDAWRVIENRPDLIFVIPTKRPERIDACLPGYDPLGAWPYSNVWFLVSCENQEMLDLRWPILARVPAAVKGISYEPALEPLYAEPCLMSCRGCGNEGSSAYDYRPGRDPRLCADACLKRGDTTSVDWVVAGCESGPKRRPTEIDWFRSLRDECIAAGVPFYLKQMDVDGRVVELPELDGRVWDQVPHAGAKGASKR